jgi:hypothetical protein
MLRFLEIAWLCIAVFTFGIACWQLFTEGVTAALFMLIVTGVATAMHFLRKKQRKRFAKFAAERKNPKE